MSTTVNTTVSTAQNAKFNHDFYDRKLLETAKTRLVHASFGQRRPIPKNHGKRAEFRRYELFTPDADALVLTEGVTPDGQTLEQTSVEAEVKQYGAYVEVSDLLDMTGFDLVLNDSAALLGEQLGTVVEWVTRDAMCAGSNVQYAGGGTSRAAITSANKLTVSEIRKAVRTLKKAKARMFTASPDGKTRKPHFVCICSPDATFDLQNDSLWQDVSKYANVEAIYSGEIGRLFGVVFVESTEAKVYDAAGASGIDVHATLVFGADAYGVVDINGNGAVQTIIKPLGSAGTDDPLDQRSTVGAKVAAYTATILNDLWLVRIEHAVSI